VYANNSARVQSAGLTVCRTGSKAQQNVEDPPWVNSHTTGTKPHVMRQLVGLTQLMYRAACTSSKARLTAEKQSLSANPSESTSTESCCKRSAELCGMHWTLGTVQIFRICSGSSVAGCAQQQFPNTIENYTTARLSDLPDASSLHFVWNIQPIQKWVHMHPFPKLS